MNAKPNPRRVPADSQVRQRRPSQPEVFHLQVDHHRNLFGVDIMEEATEICKLRLFLKLVAQVDPDPSKPNLGVEPLPDIDFNIRAGNTLVGYTTIDEIRRSHQGYPGFPLTEVQTLEVQAKATADSSTRCSAECRRTVRKVNPRLGASPTRKAAYAVSSSDLPTNSTVISPPTMALTPITPEKGEGL